MIRSQIRSTCALFELDIEYEYTVPDLVSSGKPMPFDLAGFVNENDIVVLDGYQFLYSYQQALHQQACTQVCIDDLIGDYPFAAAIINHAPGLAKEKYTNTKARLCLGLDYALLRKPFFDPFQKNKINGSAYVSMGGSDRNGFTVTVCEGLLLTENFNAIHVLCSNQFSEKQIELLKTLEKNGKVILYFNLDAQSIVDIMSECTIAFVSASTVLTEAYARGLICYTGFSTANQRMLYKGFTGNGLAGDLGDLNQLLPEQVSGKVNTHQTQVIKSLTQPLNTVHLYRELFNELANDLS
ncbi:MAG: pseG [Sediminibacterium sp.]|nr:pseG [Sediminibacterium sp.]